MFKDNLDRLLFNLKEEETETSIVKDRLEKIENIYFDELFKSSQRIFNSESSHRTLIRNFNRKYENIQSQWADK